MVSLKNVLMGLSLAALVSTGHVGYADASAFKAAGYSLAQPDSENSSRSPVIKINNHNRQHFNDQQRDAINKYNPNAAIVGQMLGGAKSLDLAGQGRTGVSPRHYAWCARQYGSYRIGDNSFVTFFGNRARCVSPFFNDKN